MKHLITCLLVMVVAAAGATPPGKVEALAYQPDEVVAIDASIGYAVHIALDPLEHVENAAIGDAEHWSVTARDGSHDVFLKPRAGALSTNLAIRTDLRSYSFALRLAHNAPPTFRVEFFYPSKQATPATPVISTAYSMQVGRDSSRIAPIGAYDDDHDTYLTFAEHAEEPAVFEVLDDGSERLVNHHTDGHVLVVHGVARQLVLRLGSAVVSIYKDQPLHNTVVPEIKPVQRLPRSDR
jgi:type IV secretion system protein VirB9